MRNWFCNATAILLASCCLPFSPVRADDKVNSPLEKSVSVTVYNQNFAVVRKSCPLTLKTGVNEFRFEDVAAKIEPATVSFKSLTAPNAVSIIEQNYEYDVLTLSSVLAKAIGKDVTIRRPSTSGLMQSQSGRLLAPPQNTGELILKTPTGVVLNAYGQFEISELPKSMFSKPTLSWKLNCLRAGEHQCEVAYETLGLSWHSNYVAIVDESESNTKLSGWATIENRSSGAYKHAEIKLLAGDVHKARQTNGGLQSINRYTFFPASPAHPVGEYSFSDYHLYTLNDRTDLNENETKQISLFNADEVHAKKSYVFDTEADLGGATDAESLEERIQAVAVKLEIQNSKTNGLGLPLPEGRVQIFKRDTDGMLQLVGDDSINHTPTDETLLLKFGKSFDLVGSHRRTNWVTTAGKKGHEITYEIILQNHKQTDVTVKCLEHARGLWNLVSSSVPFVKKTSETFEFDVPVPAGGETTVVYRIQYRSGDHTRPVGAPIPDNE